MPDYQAARTHMVDSQIHTMGVVNDDILQAFRTVPRERFVPEGRQGVAYTDEDMAIGNGRTLMEPVTHARLIQAAVPVPGDTVLDIGGTTGYSAAILSPLTSRVVALEHDAAYLGYAEGIWAELGCGNIIPHMGALAEGCPAHALYSLIIVNGTVTSLSANWIAQLAPHGRLLAIVKGAGDKIGRAILFQKGASGSISERVLFDAAVPYIPGFEPKAAFVF